MNFTSSIAEAIELLDKAEHDVRIKAHDEVVEALVLRLANARELLYQCGDQKLAARVAHSYLRVLTIGIIQLDSVNDISRAADRFFEILTDYELVKDVLTTSEHERYFGYICVARAIGAERGTLYKNTENLRRIFQEWLGRKPASGTLKSTPSLVDFLYGPGVWELYATDANHVDLIPKHFLTLGLSIRPEQSILTKDSTVLLPSNML